MKSFRLKQIIQLCSTERFHSNCKRKFRNDTISNDSGVSAFSISCFNQSWKMPYPKCCLKIWKNKSYPDNLEMIMFCVIVLKISIFNSLAYPEYAVFKTQSLMVYLFSSSFVKCLPVPDIRRIHAQFYLNLKTLLLPILIL